MFSSDFDDMESNCKDGDGHAEHSQMMRTLLEWKIVSHSTNMPPIQTSKNSEIGPDKGVWWRLQVTLMLHSRLNVLARVKECMFTFTFAHDRQHSHNKNNPLV